MTSFIELWYEHHLILLGGRLSFHEAVYMQAVYPNSFSSHMHKFAVPP
jgi:hypothetical protein